MLEQTKVRQVPNLFLKASYPLMMANRVTNLKTKKVADLTLVDALVYCHLHTRYAHFTSIGKQLFESQDTIANGMGLERKAVMRSIKRLVLVDMITQETRYDAGLKRSYYTVVEIESNEDFLFSCVVRERVEVEGEDGKKDVVQEKSVEDFVIVPSGYINNAPKKPAQQAYNHAPPKQTNKPVAEDFDAPF